MRLLKHLAKGFDNKIKVKAYYRTPIKIPVDFSCATSSILKLIPIDSTLDTLELTDGVDWSYGEGVLEFTLGHSDVVKNAVYDAQLILIDPIHTNGQEIISHTGPYRLQFRIV